MTAKNQKNQDANGLDKRLKELDNMAVETVNILAEKRLDGAPINIADIYFVLSKALQHVSVMNLAEIQEYKKRNQTNKLAI